MNGRQHIRRVCHKGFAPPTLITVGNLRFLVAEQLRQINVLASSIFLEPVARSTAPAAAIACLHAASQSEDALVLILPADHLILDEPAFLKAIDAASSAAKSGYLVSLGMRVKSPHTGYGYIRKAGKLHNFDGVFALDHFVEKPDAKRAEKFFKSGDYLWNGGIFLFSASAYLDELSTFSPVTVSSCTQAMEVCIKDRDFRRLNSTAFNDCPYGAIDTEIMEKTDKGAVVPVDIGWSDVGSWRGLWDIGERDVAENVLVGDVIIEEVTNSYLRSDGPLLGCIGLDDMVVVASQDAVLVAPKGRAEDVIESLIASRRMEGQSI
ncbi:MAG: sugar phosphate nucleotidyltransferase [Rhodospirillaceae bacterium]